MNLWQKRDGRIYTIAIGIIIEVAVKVGPLRKEDRTFYAQGNFAVEHIGHFEICLPVMPAAGFDLHRVQRPQACWPSAGCNGNPQSKMRMQIIPFLSDIFSIGLSADVYFKVSR